MTANSNYAQDLCNSLYISTEDKFLCDTVIITDEDDMVYAHSNVLASVCSHLRKAFEISDITSIRNNFLFRMKLANCSVIEIKILLQYIYTGHIIFCNEMTLDVINRVVAASHKLGLDMEKICSFYEKMLQLSGITTQTMPYFPLHEDIIIDVINRGSEFVDEMEENVNIESRMQTSSASHSDEPGKAGTSGSDENAGKGGYEEESRHLKERIAQLEAEVKLLEKQNKFVRELKSREVHCREAADVAVEERNSNTRSEDGKRLKAGHVSEKLSSLEVDVWDLLTDVEMLMKICESSTMLWNRLKLRVNKGIILYKKPDEDGECLKEVLHSFNFFVKEAKDLRPKKLEDFLNYGFERKSAVFLFENVEAAAEDIRSKIAIAVDYIADNRVPAIIIATSGNIHLLDQEFQKKFSIYYCGI